MDGAFREMGVSDMTVPKRMKTLYRSFAGRIGAYAAALGEGEARSRRRLPATSFPMAEKAGAR